MSERDLQLAAAQYLDLQGWRWCHVANERKTSVRQGGLLKKLGVKPGVPDILIFRRHNAVVGSVGYRYMQPYVGIAIELKHGKGRVTESQQEWLDALEYQGWSTHVCRTVDEVIAVCEVLR